MPRYIVTITGDARVVITYAIDAADGAEAEAKAEAKAKRGHGDGDIECIEIDWIERSKTE